MAGDVTNAIDFKDIKQSVEESLGRCDVVETATEEELLAEIERRRRAGLLPKGTSNDGFSDLVDDLWGKLDTDPDR